MDILQCIAYGISANVHHIPAVLQYHVAYRIASVLLVCVQCNMAFLRVSVSDSRGIHILSLVYMA